MSSTQHRQPPRKKRPVRVAEIDRDGCTGCQACVQVCPVDCIDFHATGTRIMGIETWCEIDTDRCIGCQLCIRLPRRQSDAYELKICPWDAIVMVPTPPASGTPAGSC